MTSHTAPVETFDYLVFGGTGDLALRKLLPSLYLRDKAGQITATSRIIGVSRSQLTPADYKAKAEQALRRHLHEDEFDEKTWERFGARIDYVAADATSTNGWDQLQEHLGGRDEVVRVFYLATSPELFGPISERLQAFGLVTAKSRVVLEKPIGHDLESARQINDEVGSVFAEEQIYRIDHYLGKETVQNLLALRFANSMFEPLWNSGHIDHVQITVAETVGVESRGGYYDTSGALRDMVQNHLMQLVCLVGMEPPVSLDKEAVRDEKIKVLRSLSPIGIENISTTTVRGQYRAGAVGGAAVRGYLEEEGIGSDSNTETFVALKAEVRNWRWAGVPFYLRTGKRMEQRSSEVVIVFKPVPHPMFPDSDGSSEPNKLVIQLQPKEGMLLHMTAKEPGPGGIRLKPVSLDLNYT